VTDSIRRQQRDLVRMNLLLESHGTDCTRSRRRIIGCQRNFTVSRGRETDGESAERSIINADQVVLVDGDSSAGLLVTGDLGRDASAPDSDDFIPFANNWRPRASDRCGRLADQYSISAAAGDLVVGGAGPAIYCQRPGGKG